MISVPINYWAVLVAAVANMFIGYLWFGPLFGKLWRRLGNIQMHEMTALMKKKMMWNYVLLSVASLLISFILAHAIIFAGSYLLITGVMSGLMTGLMSWIGFVLPVTMGVVMWEGKSWKYWAVTYLYYLVSFLVMGAILGGWM